MHWYVVWKHKYSFCSKFTTLLSFCPSNSRLIHRCLTVRECPGWRDYTFVTHALEKPHNLYGELRTQKIRKVLYLWSLTFTTLVTVMITVFDLISRKHISALHNWPVRKSSSLILLEVVDPMARPTHDRLVYSFGSHQMHTKQFGQTSSRLTFTVNNIVTLECGNITHNKLCDQVTPL